MSDMTWILEENVFRNGDALRDAAPRAGHAVRSWSDAWWSDGSWPRMDEPVLFHGSLGNADRIARELPWQPGSYCATAHFACSSWYPRAAPWLLNERWELIAADELIARRDEVLDRIGAGDAAFVRPDSALKPFSGRVLARNRLSLAALDHGFYFDDPSLPVVVAPFKAITREWRWIVVDGSIVAGSAYTADGRQAADGEAEGAPKEFAADVATRLMPPPEAVYVLDTCETGGDLRLVELNPFSGADLYGCDADAIVRAIAALQCRR